MSATTRTADRTMTTGGTANGRPTNGRTDELAQGPVPTRPKLLEPELRIAVGITAYLSLLGALAVPATLWAFRIADQVTTARPLVNVRWVGPQFSADALTSVLLLAAVGGVVGSLVHAGHLFSRRLARSTFEASYLVWYLLRPLLSALLGMTFVAVIRIGLVSLSAKGTDFSTPYLSFAVGALAVLFLDTVLQKMRAILGATAVDEKASEQEPPEGGAKDDAQK